MPKVVRYIARVETRVVVSEELNSGGEIPVGEYVVYGEVARVRAGDSPVQDMVTAALVQSDKRARIMSAGVDNTERNRLK